MAILDPRLLDLFETLMASRLDWLVAELVAGIQAGRRAEEPEEALAAAREAIRTNLKPKARSEPQGSMIEPQRIEGDAQIEWAAAYVEERLDATLAQLEASIDTLDFIVAGTKEHPDTRKALAQDLAKTKGRAISVLLHLEGDRKSDREGAVEARATVPALRVALREWAQRTRGPLAT